jgi:hypothetical protein
LLPNQKSELKCDKKFLNTKKFWKLATEYGDKKVAILHMMPYNRLRSGPEHIPYFGGS